MNVTLKIYTLLKLYYYVRCLWTMSPVWCLPGLSSKKLFRRLKNKKSYQLVISTKTLGKITFFHKKFSFKRFFIKPNTWYCQLLYTAKFEMHYHFSINVMHSMLVNYFVGTLMMYFVLCYRICTPHISVVRINGLRVESSVNFFARKIGAQCIS